MYVHILRLVVVTVMWRPSAVWCTTRAEWKHVR